jgi:hypothetical protein
MSGLVAIDPKVMGLIHTSLTADGGLMPFAKEIMLIEGHVAGTSYRELDAVEASLVPGMLLVLKREPSNPHDPLAIMICTETGEHLGYVPKNKNEAIARLMDAGKLLFGRLETKTKVEDWLKLGMRIYLRDL